MSTCSMDAKCSSVCSGALSNVKMYLCTVSHWYKLAVLLRRYVCPQPNIYVISDRGIRILATIERQGSLWDCTHHRYCLRHIASNYYGLSESPFGSYELCRRSVQNRIHVQCVKTHIPTVLDEHNCIKNHKVDLARVKYVIIWISRKNEPTEVVQMV
ncbi:hypothetical protein PVK06_020762 [Gossypium arboreum]|uniref:Uncharacterized protein n=1 Tax=Gossypium arboreum TaxID=29729 RepID=A0ABR0PN77_GOSAR|nr:hypothetical protein PVK06_020762 [Gossypium arboreum]